MSQHRFQSLIAALLAAVALAGAASSSAYAATPPRSSPPATGGPVNHPLFGDDSAPRGSAQAGMRAAATSGITPFLTRPYWGRHYVTSVFDHCNPNYSIDGKICEEDGTVASRSNGADPSFSRGYAVTPGGSDYVYYDGHDGWDLSVSYETLIATAEGTVTLAGCESSGCGGFGLTVLIDHGNGFTTRYAHMNRIDVSVGQHVLRGQSLGQSGNSGASTGPHLHFGLYLTSSMTAIDPWGWSATTADPWPYDQGDLWITGNMRDPVPDAPTGVVASSQPNGVQVSWTPPAFNGGETITSYTVTPSNGAAPQTVPGTATSVTLNQGLVSGVSYTFTVTATNKVATSAASGASNPIVYNSPAAVRFTSAPPSSYATADFDISWTTPQPGSYDVLVGEDGAALTPWMTGISTTTVHHYGIAGHSYVFKVLSRVGAFSDNSTTAAYTVPAGTPQRFPVNSLQVMEGTGAIDPAGSEFMARQPTFNIDITRASVLLPGGDGGYLLDGYGGIHPFGAAPDASGAPYFGFDIARDIVLTPGAQGGYVLDGWGGVHPFGVGTATPPPVPSGGGYWPSWDIARRLTIASDGTGYLLDGYAGLHPLGGAPAVKSAPYFNFDIARAVVTIGGTHQGYLLDGYGGVHPWSADATVPARPVAPGYWPGQDRACALVLAPGATTANPIGYKIDSGGGVNPVAGAPALPQPAVHGPVRTAAAA